MAFLTDPFTRALDSNGDPVPGAKLAIYTAGTTNLVTTYTDASLTTVGANPRIADGEGEFPAVYLPSGTYKIRILDASDNLLRPEVDNVRIADRPEDPISLTTTPEVLASTDSYATGTRILTTDSGITYIVADPSATDHTDTTAGGVKLYETGHRFSDEDAFRAAVARGVTYAENDVVIAGGREYIFANDGGTLISGLTGWYKRPIVGLVGSTSSPTFFENPDFNYIDPDADIGGVGSGNTSNPNIVGAPVENFDFVGDGSTTAFVCACSFTVTSETYRNVMVVERSVGVRAPTLRSEGTHFSVSGYGTSTITVTMNTAPATGVALTVSVYAKESAGNNPLLNFAPWGYNLATDGDGPMTVLVGAHHREWGNAGGHNFFAGGSVNEMKNSCSYAFASGQGHVLDGVILGTAMGGRGQLSGNSPFHAGASGIVGGYSFHFGQEGDASPLYSGHIVRKGKAAMAGEFVRGAGAFDDADKGMMQTGVFPFRKTLTSATGTKLLPLTGTDTYVIPENSIAIVSGIFTLVDRADSTRFRVIELQTAVKRDTGGATTVIGANAAAADQITTLDEGGTLPAAPGWQVQVFGSAVSGGFVIQGRGETGVDIECYGDVTVRIVSRDAAAT